MRIAVTGGSGKLGRSVVRRLRDEGHEVVNLDRVGARGEVVLVDLTDHGQVADALAGIDGGHRGLDAVVHLAAIPAPGIVPDVATFHHNMLATYNVFQAARRAGVRRLVYASSETVLGLPFDTPPPYEPPCTPMRAGSASPSSTRRPASSWTSRISNRVSSRRIHPSMHAADARFGGGLPHDAWKPREVIDSAA